MPGVFWWRTQTGTRTPENRDHGGVGVRAGQALCMLMDGSSQSPSSREWAREAVKDTIDWYVAHDGAFDLEVVISRLSRVHARLSPLYPLASASCLLAHLSPPDGVTVIWAGDSLAGRRPSTGPVEWIIEPHTLANPLGGASIREIALQPARHRLTRSFRARGFICPETRRFTLSGDLVLATDGVWADMTPDDQSRFLEGLEARGPSGDDDRSALGFRFETRPDRSSPRLPPSSDTLYVRWT